MAVAGPVVGEDALLGGGLDVLEPRADAAVRVADVLGLGERDGALEDVERRARVAAGEDDEVLEGVVGERDAAVGPERAGQPALLVGRAPGGRRSPTSSSVSGSRRQTRIRDRSAELTSK